MTTHSRLLIPLALLLSASCAAPAASTRQPLEEPAKAAPFKPPAAEPTLTVHFLDVGQGDETWVVLDDPEGNEFCVLSSR